MPDIFWHCGHRRFCSRKERIGDYLMGEYNATGLTATAVALPLRWSKKNLKHCPVLVSTTAI